MSVTRCNSVPASARSRMLAPCSYMSRPPTGVCASSTDGKYQGHLAHDSAENEPAWALASALKPRLNASQRNHIFAAIGADDGFTAIRTLLKCIAAKRIAVEPELAGRCASWLQPMSVTKTSITFVA